MSVSSNFFFQCNMFWWLRVDTQPQRVKPLSKCFNFHKNELTFFFANNMNINTILHLMIPSARQNVNFIKIRYKYVIIRSFWKTLMTKNN